MRHSALLVCAFFLVQAGAAAQTCRTSLTTGTIVCDNGATARTSPVTGTTTFTDGRTARTSPVTGTTRFSDGTSFRADPVRLASPPAPRTAALASVDEAGPRQAPPRGAQSSRAGKPGE